VGTAPSSPRFPHAFGCVAGHSWRRWPPCRPGNGNRSTSSGSSCELARAGPRRPSPCDTGRRAAEFSWLRRPARPKPWTDWSRWRSAWSSGRRDRRQDPRRSRNGHNNRRASRSAWRAAVASRSCCRSVGTRHVSGGFGALLNCQA